MNALSVGFPGWTRIQSSEADWLELRGGSFNGRKAINFALTGFAWHLWTGPVCFS